MSGEIVYFELPGNDARATEQFWGSLFDWTFRVGNFPGYSMIHGSNPIGGTPHGDASQHPRIFFSVDDIAAATTRVRELGGSADEPVRIPTGAFANCTDDQGVQFSLFEAARSQ
ncbi:VOC family protein [Nocardia sp. NBC_00508]|uniref:VOC family protein n=1 Tax=Nocardia sp. NBC_00508 TaxID=2975992 RepID=UPI002E80D4FA|nr:VOC family protein [Nocardia sp. NBC_00508]WUD67324.1 VOC family protein [Nocardia sp. NBC_00508]